MPNPSDQPTHPRPFDGVKVLDLSNLMAAPLIGMYLADFGAEVYKFERPKVGDGNRHWGQKKNGVALFFKVNNRNKRMVTLELSSPEGQEIVRKLVKDFDVVIENYRPGTMERWGLGYDTLSEINPDIIMVRVTGWGQTGPYSDRRGQGTLAEAFAGTVYANGFPDRPPISPPFGLGDASAGIFGAMGVALALYARDVQKTGGQFIDLALYDGLFTLMGPHVINYDQTGVIQERGLSSNVIPRGTYETSDGRFVALSGGVDERFPLVARTLKLEAMLDDDRYSTNVKRIENAAEVDRMVRDAVGSMTFDELMANAKAEGATLGPVLSIADIFQDPHIAARQNIVSVEDPDFGSVRMQSVVPRLSKTPGYVAHTGGGLGQDNEEFYREALGFSATELDELKEKGVI